MAETSNSIKTALIGVGSALLLAIGYNYIGIDSSGNKIEPTNINPAPSKLSSEEIELKKKELDIKEKELQLKMKQLEAKVNHESLDFGSTDYELSGSWTGNNGFKYQIAQTGNRISYTESNSLFGQQYTASSGSGIIDGNKITYNGFGIWGQQIQLQSEIIGEKTMKMTGYDANNNPVSVILTKD